MLLAAISSSTVLAVVVLVALLVLGVALVARKRGQGSQAAGSAAVVTPASPTADEQQVAEPGQVDIAPAQAQAVVEPAIIVAPSQTPEAVGPTVEAPESAEQRANRLRSRFSKSQGGLGQSLRALFSGGDIAGETWDDLEDTLIMSDVGVTAAGLVIDRLKSAIRSAGASDAAAVDALVRQELTQIIDGGFDRSLKTSRHDDRPAIVLTIGVNGTGKTTTTGKLARLLVSQDQDVLLGAADTFRAAAAEQLTTWGDRIGVQ